MVEKGLSTEKSCKLSSISKSSWYRRQQNRKIRQRKKKALSPADKNIIRLLKIYRRKRFFQSEGGYRKISAYIQRDYGIVVNHKRVYRLAKQAGVLLPRKRKKRFRSRLKAAKRIVDRPHQLWQFDIKYCYIHGENRFCYLCSFIDVFTRQIRGYYIGLSCRARDIQNLLKETLKQHQITEESGLYLRSDNGPQMSSRSFETYLSQLPVIHEFIPCRSPNDNAYIESFHSSLEIGCLSSQKFRNYSACYENIVSYIEFYNNHRIHGKLKCSPREFEALFRLRGKNDKYTISA